MEALVLAAILGSVGGSPCVIFKEIIHSSGMKIVMPRGSADGVEVGWKLKLRWWPDGVYAIVKSVSEHESVAEYIERGGCRGDPMPTCFELSPP